MTTALARVGLAILLFAASARAADTGQDLPPAPILSIRIAIGDRALQVYCAGTGSPLVLFEAGYGGGAETWDEVLPGVSATTRACVYDRAGIGGSDPPPLTPRTAADVANDLSALLRVIGPGEQVILVGFSIGGLFARYYAATFPQQIGGLVLIDPTPPEWPSMSLAGVAAPYAELRLRQLTGVDSREPELIDTLEVGLQAMLALPVPAPVFILTPGIVSLNPGAYGDQLTRVLTHLQAGQRADLGAEAKTAEHCTHTIPLECPEEAVDAVINMVSRVRGDITG